MTDKKKNVRWNSSEQLHTLIKKIKRGIARLLDAYQDSLIDKSEFEPRMRRAKERLAKLKAEVKKREREDEEAQQKELSLVIGHMQDFADKVSSNLEGLDWLKRREIIRALVKQVEVDKEVVRIVYRVNPPPFYRPLSPKKVLLQHCLRRDN